MVRACARKGIRTVIARVEKNNASVNMIWRERDRRKSRKSKKRTGHENRSFVRYFSRRVFYACRRMRLAIRKPVAHHDDSSATIGRPHESAGAYKVMMHRHRRGPPGRRRGGRPDRGHGYARRSTVAAAAACDDGHDDVNERAGDEERDDCFDFILLHSFGPWDIP